MVKRAVISSGQSGGLGVVDDKYLDVEEALKDFFDNLNRYELFLAFLSPRASIHVLGTPRRSRLGPCTLRLIL